MCLEIKDKLLLRFYMFEIRDVASENISYIDNFSKTHNIGKIN